MEFLNTDLGDQWKHHSDAICLKSDKLLKLGLKRQPQNLYPKLLEVKHHAFRNKQSHVNYTGEEHLCNSVFIHNACIT